MSKIRVKTLLISLPWADFCFPSIKIGALCAYARKCGLGATALHLHLEIAANMGIEAYSGISPQAGEALAAALLFPERKKVILRSLKSWLKKPEQSLLLYISALKRSYSQINWNDYHLAGFPTDMSQIFSSLLLSSWLKRDYPKIKIVLGGQSASGILGKSILKCFPQVDWCVDGEGEIPLVSLINGLGRANENFEKQVPGLIYRQKNTVVLNPRQQLKNLAGLPDPDYKHYFELLKNHPVLQKEDFAGYLPIEGGRGCTHSCAFCRDRLQMDGYRARPYEEIAEQIQRLSNRYRSIRFNFVDLRTPPLNSWKLFKYIEKQNRDYFIFYEIRADAKKSLLSAMHRAGVRSIQIGIEALSTRLLKKMNKGLRFIHNLQAMKFCEELDIAHESNILLGFPAENQRDIDESTKNIEHAAAYRPPVSLVSFRLYEGTQVDQKREIFGLKKVRDDPFLKKLLPAALTNRLKFMSKRFHSNRIKPDYSAFKKRHKRWCEEHQKARSDRIKLLSYWDCKNFIRIEDYRNGTSQTVIIDGFARGLFLYCDSIRSLDDIKKKFSKESEKDLKNMLQKLIKAKVMYREEKLYLSLPIHNSSLKPEAR